MMKRFLTMITAAILLLTAVCTAMADGVTFSTKYFTLQLPDGWETETDLESTEEDEEEDPDDALVLEMDQESEQAQETLGFFGEPSDEGLVAAAYLVYYKEMKDVKLWDASEEELKEYTDGLLKDLEDVKPELIGVVKADKVPLVLIKGSDEDGEFLYADTVTNGYAIEFEFYISDAEGEKQLPFTDTQIEQVKTILATFKPAA